MKTWLAQNLLLLSQHTPFRGRGGYSASDFAKAGDTQPFPQARTEASRVEDFFNFFTAGSVRESIEGKSVLDFGSGYGGRTVAYGRWAQQVIGVEPFKNLITASAEYAASMNAANVEFRLCAQDRLPLQSESVDVVLSYDVLEHVQDPMISMREIHRVLRPGGKAFLVFPVYFGAFSHHLDYVSLLPGLHWMFSAHTLVNAVNKVIDANPKYGVSRQPEPTLSFDKRRYVLPNLNGLGGKHIHSLLSGFTKATVQRHGWLRRRQVPSKAMKLLGKLPNLLLDPITSSVSCVLWK